MQYIYLGTLEEDHVATKDEGERVPVEVALRPVLGQLEAVGVTVRHLLPPLGVAICGPLLKLYALNCPLGEGAGVELHVDLLVRSQHLHLLQDTGEVAHQASDVSLVLLDLPEKLIKVILVRLEEPVFHVPLRLPLAPPEGGQLADVSSPPQLPEYVVGLQEALAGGEGVDVGAEAARQVGGVHLHAGLLGGLHRSDPCVHVLLTPALGPEVVHVNSSQHLLHHGWGLGVGGSSRQEEKKGRLHGEAWSKALAPNTGLYWAPVHLVSTVVAYSMYSPTPHCTHQVSSSCLIIPDRGHWPQDG